MVLSFLKACCFFMPAILNLLSIRLQSSVTLSLTSGEFSFSWCLTSGSSASAFGVANSFLI